MLETISIFSPNIYYFIAIIACLHSFNILSKLFKKVVDVNDINSIIINDINHRSGT